MRSSETLNIIEKLKADLKPVKKRSSAKTKLWLSLLGVVYLAIALYALPPRKDLIAALGHTPYLALNLISILVFFFGINFLHHFYDFGNKRDSSTKAIKNLTVLGLALVGVSAYLSYSLLGAGESFEIRPVDWICFKLALMISLPLFLLLSASELYFPKLRSGQLLFRLSLAVGSGIFVENIHCPVSSNGHHFLGHTLMPIIGGLGVALAFEFVFSALFKLAFLSKFKKLKKAMVSK